MKGVGHFDRPLKAEGDVAHQPLLGGRKLEGLYKNFAGKFFGLVTGGHNNDYQDRASIAASRGKKA